MAANEGISEWIEAEYRIAAEHMLRCISATGVVHHRRAFDRFIRPARGSVVASLEPGSYAPEPDYFFHWFRDAALVMRAVSLLGQVEDMEDGPIIIADFIRFESAFSSLDASAFATRPDLGLGAQESVRPYLRRRDELARLRGDRLRTEARCNPDGTIDEIQWARPQHDGPALRALTLIRHAQQFGTTPELVSLVMADLDFVTRVVGSDDYDLWEERFGGHYYTRLVHYGALTVGAEFAAQLDQMVQSKHYRLVSRTVLADLDCHWQPACGAFRSMASDDAMEDRDLDFAVILAVLHAGLPSGPHSTADCRVLQTFAKLERIFASDYAINWRRPGQAPAMGRFRGDTYQGGGPFYLCTLAAAELHYRLVADICSGQTFEVVPGLETFLANTGVNGSQWASCELTSAFISRGDAFMATVRQFTPPSGILSEQFDKEDGQQTSARDLAWSHAAFIAACIARRAALKATNQ